MDGIMLFAYMSMLWIARGVDIDSEVMDVVYMACYAQGNGFVQDTP